MSVNSAKSQQTKIISVHSDYKIKRLSKLSEPQQKLNFWETLLMILFIILKFSNSSLMEVQFFSTCLQTFDRNIFHTTFQASNDAIEIGSHHSIQKDENLLKKGFSSRFCSLKNFLSQLNVNSQCLLSKTICHFQFFYE